MKKKSAMYLDTKIISDPDGSYTGQPLDAAELPMQDVDDL